MIEKLADFLRLLLPYGSTSAGQTMLPSVTPDVKVGLMVEAPDTASMDSYEGESSYVPGEATVKAFSEQ